MLNRNHPYLCFFLGMVLCGLKFPFNWIFRDNESRQSKMETTSFGILSTEPKIIDAWDRIEGKAPDGDGKYGRMAHNLTNLPIEWDREWVPYSTKFFCSLIVYGYLLFMVAIGLIIAL